MNEEIKAEIKRVEERQDTHSILSAWNRSESSWRISWRITAAHLIGELNGLRFALGLLQGKIEEIETEIKRVEKKQSDNFAFSSWRIVARLKGKLNGLRFTLDLLKGKGDER